MKDFTSMDFELHFLYIQKFCCYIYQQTWRESINGERKNDR
ncbi:hypothetical protein HMPREF3220_03219 [Citrobacter koseri]|nr:hypothetical protein HMPREF3220_03219 [Citrobacter koseri]KXA00311.1 hypothetical protein HMPREF3207_03618 [Citrobacter koseri]